mmetsp:Transcript_41896/g.89427  ORF Transcript_41896/g.89427 Transcript_41896/m.89427 type:complete len:83 (-) Transcript_41896:1004-1252(-)|eukprot:CAMPEP_0183341236 /NCGR_PEP_ID=MMETSP0164_2-20130417/7512_1 /TAXON_ID=221442 /ORGANISM="Coccolithus pelagicus ssp braarudi, Strain PLY182g" /LENGTH=82 /DNA_ID=CAMNT_0025511495 /DNA_START=134 /DNA_END=382 /DNA_ORIENTATION=-
MSTEVHTPSTELRHAIISSESWQWTADVPGADAATPPKAVSIASLMRARICENELAAATSSVRHRSALSGSICKALVICSDP